MTRIRVFGVWSRPPLPAIKPKVKVKQLKPYRPYGTCVPKITVELLRNWPLTP